MTVSAKQNEISINNVRYVFVEGDSDRCKRCALCHKTCLDVPCAPMWRDDHKNGYFVIKNKFTTKKI